MSGQQRGSEIRRKLRRRGWHIELGRGGHYKCYPPNGGPFVTLSCSPGPGAQRNIQAMIKRAERGFYAERV